MSVSSLGITAEWHLQYLDRHTVSLLTYCVSIEIQTCMSIDKQYVHRHTRSTLNQVTSIFLAWRIFTGQFASKCNCRKKCEKKKPIFLYLFQNFPLLHNIKLSLYSSAISCFYMLSRKIMCADRHTVSRLTYSISIDIHGVYVNRDTVCRSRYCMSIGCCAYLNVNFSEEIWKFHQ